MSETFEGEVTLSMGEHQNTTSLKLEKDFSYLNISIIPDKVIVNTSVQVTCTVSGGVPTPSVTFMLMDSDNKTVNGSESRFTSAVAKADVGEGVDTHTSTFVPRLEDQGLVPCCRAEQSSGEQILHKESKVILTQLFFHLICPFY